MIVTINYRSIVQQNNISVERLDLTGNGMGDEGGVALAKVIRDNEYITEFVNNLVLYFPHPFTVHSVFLDVLFSITVRRCWRTT